MQPDIHVSASVALIEYVQGPCREILVLRRAFHESDPWSGQLSFPGGRKELADQTLLDTCIRETYEECRIRLNLNNVVAELPIAVAGRSHGAPIYVKPWHLRMNEKPVIDLDQREMQSYFWVDVNSLQDPSLHGEYLFQGQRFPCFWLEGVPLWGFTYGVILGWLRQL